MSQVPRHPPPELRRAFGSSLAEVDGVCHAVRAFLDEHDEPRAGFVLDLVVRECINNAIIHGNRQDADKVVTMSLRISRRYFCVQVEDQGTGFAWRSIQRRQIPDEVAVRGRGLPIIEMYARRVRFNQPGNRIAIWLERGMTKER